MVTDYEPRSGPNYSRIAPPVRPSPQLQAFQLQTTTMGPGSARPVHNQPKNWYSASIEEWKKQFHREGRFLDMYAKPASLYCFYHYGPRPDPGVPFSEYFHVAKSLAPPEHALVG